jgi:Xaa-Pro aminopeptidase
MRIHKEPAELEIMRRAAEITREAHVAAAQLARDGTFEYELEAPIEHVFRRRGGAGPAYTTIVGGGKNATILHYITNDQPLRDGELVLIDAGVELAGYASDVTRTFPVGGTFTGARRAVYEVVLSAQEAALDRCKPGSTLVDVHDAAVRAIAEGLIELKLLTGTADEAIANETYRRFYMHNTSHWLGLDVHDAGAYRVKGEARTLDAGIVFTVEPGIYIAADDETAPAEFRGIGVRIEDDVAMNADGCEILTASIPRRADEIEALIGGN